jgi:hypothetical protein
LNNNIYISDNKCFEKFLSFNNYENIKNNFTIISFKNKDHFGSENNKEKFEYFRIFIKLLLITVFNFNDYSLAIDEINFFNKNSIRFTCLNREFSFCYSEYVFHRHDYNFNKNFKSKYLKYKSKYLNLSKKNNVL